MGLDVEGLTEPVQGGMVTINVKQNHRLLKLARHLPWEAMLERVLPDLQRTERNRWWMGRPLRVRIHLGVYVLQTMFDLTDRAAEQHVRDNAAFRLFCGFGLVKKWHAPDHSKIETFRSRLGPEPLIGHTKLGGQMGRSRMKSDEATKSAGYASVLGFNLRQLTCYLAGEVRQKVDKMAEIVANEAPIDGKLHATMT